METIEHTLFFCSNIRALWLNIIEWLEKNNYYELKLEIKPILLGPSINDPVLYTVTTIVKHFIYKGRQKCKAPSLKMIQRTIMNHMKIEEYFAMGNYKSDQFLGKWSPIYYIFKEREEEMKYLFFVQTVFTCLYWNKSYKKKSFKQRSDFGNIVKPITTNKFPSFSRSQKKYFGLIHAREFFPVYIGIKKLFVSCDGPKKIG